jgi:hypothetical protein
VIKGGRTLGAVAGHGLRRLRAGAVGVGCAHCDYERIVSGSADGGIAARAGIVVFTHVAGGNHDNDTCFPRRFDRLAERTEGIAFIHAARQRNIHHADVISALQIDGCLNCGNYRAATSALDTITQSEILNLFRQLNRDLGMAILYISHDLLSVAALCDRIAILNEGKIAECDTPEMIFDSPRHPYTRRLIAALPTRQRRNTNDEPSASLAEELFSAGFTSRS